MTKTNIYLVIYYLYCNETYFCKYITHFPIGPSNNTLPLLLTSIPSTHRGYAAKQYNSEQVLANLECCRAFGYNWSSPESLGRLRVTLQSNSTLYSLRNVVRDS